jgi:16S rRNA C967 or C1407 C5-methylase (RsmB/RsmF family)
MQEQLGTEAEAFFNSLSENPVTSIRLNHLKGKASFLNLEKIPWSRFGYYLESRPFFHLDPHWHGGAYYVQEASSMIIDSVLQQLNIEQKPKIWLDVCAAPGGKTGIISQYLQDHDVLIANEIVPQRRTVLYENLYKGGYQNTFVAGEKPSAFNEPFADIILVDAPCAGEGMMRKEDEAINQWSPGLVRECALMQHRILHDVAKALLRGGYMIYSTCSYSHAENIDNVIDLVKSFPFTSLTFNFPEEWNISVIEKGGITGYQLFPHKVKGEGLFFSVLRNDSSDSRQPSKFRKPEKKFNTIAESLKPHVENHDQLKFIKDSLHHSFIRAEAEEKGMEVLSRFPRAELIAEAGQIKGKDYIPSHFLPMANLHVAIETIELSLDQSLDYLERNTRFLPVNKPPGWYLITFQGTLLGWVKNTVQGWKNHYPLNWRLRNRKMN